MESRSWPPSVDNGMTRDHSECTVVLSAVRPRSCSRSGGITGRPYPRRMATLAFEAARKTSKTNDEKDREDLAEKCRAAVQNSSTRYSHTFSPGEGAEPRHQNRKGAGNATSARRDPRQQPTRVLCRRQRSGTHATPQTPGNQRNHQRTSPRVSSIPGQ